MSSADGVAPTLADVDKPPIHHTWMEDLRLYTHHHTIRTVAFVDASTVETSVVGSDGEEALVAHVCAHLFFVGRVREGRHDDRT